MEQTIKMIVTDMDGTFLNHQSKLSSDTFEVLENLKEKGIEFAVASGRHYQSLNKKMHGADIIYISENGTEIIEHGKAVFVSSIQKDMIQEIIQTIDSLDHVGLILSSKQGGIGYRLTTKMYDECIEYYGIINQVHTIDLSDIDINMITLITDPKDRQMIYETYCKQYEDRFTVLHKDNWIKISNQHMNKGNAVMKLIEEHHYKENELMLFGDDINDVEMLSLNQRTYAMKHSTDSLKKKAKYVLEDHDTFSVIKEIKNKLDV